MNVIRAITRVLNRAFAVISGGSMLACTALAAVNLVTRAFGAPVTGSYELVGFLGAVAVACGLGYTQVAKGHVIVNIITDRFSPGVNKVLDAANHAVGAAFWGLVAWQTVKWGMEIGRSGELSQTLRIPYYPVVFMSAAGIAVFAVTLVFDFILIFTPEGEGIIE